MKKYLFLLVALSIMGGGLISTMPLQVVAVESQIKPHDWASKEELEIFFKEHGKELILEGQAGRDGIIQFNDACSAWALGLRTLAWKYGRNIEVIFVSPIEYQRVFERGINSYHLLNMAIVGQADIYFIEPQNLQIKLAGYIP